MNLAAGKSKFVFLDESGQAFEFVPALYSDQILETSQFLSTQLKVGSTIGLLFKSEICLIIVWLASLRAGLKPLVLQYPTRKQSRLYWVESVAHTITNVGLGAVLADDHCRSVLGSSLQIPLLAPLQIRPPSASFSGDVLPARFDIIQLSSGTTGFRKAVEFSSEHLARHAKDFDAVLKLRRSDKIVSWLPLYHDMGYVACFVMPLLLGIDVVMMDPITWTQKPEILFDAIERFGCTVCYMPNFGFEVMARVKGRRLPTMRRWISCSEPVSEATSKKFLAAIQASYETFSPCYAMAENIFAVSIGTGLKTLCIDGVDVVSCGTPIPGVQIKTVDGEIWVKSPTSLQNYDQGPDIRDDDGYYPTGDLGEFVDGDLFVSGRKQDLLVQGGRKFILSDIDLKLNEAFPDVRGRGAALAFKDVRIGTETPLILIEAQEFFARGSGKPVATKLKDMTGLDQVDVEFVPPRFLTKTSSGKINRKKAAADWTRLRMVAGERHGTVRNPLAEMKTSFANVDWNEPVGNCLDSLSRTILDIVLQPTGLQVSRLQTLNDIQTVLEAKSKVAPGETSPGATGILIISLANRPTLTKFSELHRLRLSDAFGCEVTFEHLCLPPSAIILSDMIFYDYFSPRLSSEELVSVGYAMRQLKRASMIITDDMAEMTWRYESTYPVLSHNLERDPRADLISFRWQQYTRNHHNLPIGLVCGMDMPLLATSDTLERLSAYLNVPIYRIAVVQGFGAYTRDWEFRSAGSHRVGVDADRLVDELVAWVGRRPQPLKQSSISTGSRFSVSDLPHFCSHAVNKALVDRVLDHFDSFCIAGEQASLPYVRAELARMGKPYIQVSSHAPEMLAKRQEVYDCILLCGPVGDFSQDLPIVALQHADAPWRFRNLGGFADSLPVFGDMPRSSTDWYYSFNLSRQNDREIWSKARAQLISDDLPVVVD